ncbi:branched-chain amino acid transport system substrate-binding protein [Caballeronia udeis]|uniref:Branched-chain amino acid transport system substrate-binding protein n=2 Tax=Caballeronia udeis TaxID=1232866 RepID=A0ABW8MZ10_9BURK
MFELSQFRRQFPVVGLALALQLPFMAVNAFAQDAVVQIGLAAPMTGAYAGYGKDTANSAQLAIDEANARKLVIGGKPIKLQLVSVDDQGDPRIAVQVAQQLVDNRVVAVIGHFNSGTTIPASQIYGKAGIPMITPAATNPAITQGGLSTVYRVMATDTQNSGTAGKYAATVVKAKRIAILDDRTAFGAGEADEFEKAVRSHGSTIVSREYTSDKAVDFSAQLTKIKSQDVDLLFFGGLDTQAGMVVKRMRQLGMKATFLAGGGVADANFIKIAGDASEGSLAWDYGLPLESLPNGKTFAVKYKKTYGIDLLPYGPFGYDAANVLVKAIESANSTNPADINAAIKKIQITGITGPIAFFPNGDLKSASSTLYEVKGGQWVVVTTGDPGV